MKRAFKTILPCLIIALILPLLLYRFRVTPWSAPFTYWNGALMSFAISFLVYKYRQSGEGDAPIPFRTHLTNFLISFLGLCIVAGVYLIILSILYAAI